MRISLISVLLAGLLLPSGVVGGEIEDCPPLEPFEDACVMPDGTVVPPLVDPETLKTVPDGSLRHAHWKYDYQGDRLDRAPVARELRLIVLRLDPEDWTKNLDHAKAHDWDRRFIADFEAAISAVMTHPGSTTFPRNSRGWKGWRGASISLFG